MTTTTLQPLIKEEKIQKVRDAFHRYGWRTQRVHKFADVYMVYKPNCVEYCFFIAYRDGDKFNLLPELPKAESYQEAKYILNRTRKVFEELEKGT